MSNQLEMTIKTEGSNKVIDTITYEGSTLYSYDSENEVILGESTYEFDIKVYLKSGSTTEEKHNIEVSQTHSSYTIKPGEGSPEEGDL